MENCFSVRQTTFLIRKNEALLNELRFSITSDKEYESEIKMNGDILWNGMIKKGNQEIIAYIPEPKEEKECNFTIAGLGEVKKKLRKPKHWRVHLVQFSHHDPGYTDVPSHVLEDSYPQIKCGLELLEKREDWPDDTKPRFIIEQAYSLYHFLKDASREEKERLYTQIRTGNIEVTALWANLISEILTPEEAIRALYPSAAIAEETGVPIVSAEHNDITSFTWGYSTVLCRAGIKYFLPGLPLYYGWGGNSEYESFWDEKAIFGNNVPGAFWWESPEGQKIFLWSGNHGCGDESSYTVEELYPELERLEEENWDYDVIRWEVRGAPIDNYGYVSMYSDLAREWNEKYEFPHMICSTDKMFCEEFLKVSEGKLPTYKGGIDGQDYPVASTSQMSSSARARQLHGLYRTAELINSLAEGIDGKRRLDKAVEDIMFADEHAFGFFEPAEPMQLASWWEHGVYAARAWADVWEVLNRSMAKIAEEISDANGNPRLTVFRTSGSGENRAIDIPCNRLTNEWLDGKFRLVDRETGKDVDYSLQKIDWKSVIEAAAPRYGMGQGTKWTGRYDEPYGYGYNLVFTAENLPACGYKTYDLIPCEEVISCKSKEITYDSVEASEYIENEFYMVVFDRQGINEIIDKATGEDMIDHDCEATFGSILVRDKNEKPREAQITGVRAETADTVSRIYFDYEIDGLYSSSSVLSLYRTEDRIHFDARLVKSSKPLETVFIAFPFKGTGVKYQSVLHDTEPLKDTLPGSQSDMIAVQDWVLTKDSDILWNSKNAPVVMFSHLWDGYISPAHRCVMSPPPHPPLTADKFDTGHIYSVLTCNNFGTNFFTAQLSDAVFSYSFAKRHERSCWIWGIDSAETIPAVFSYGKGGTGIGTAELLNVKGLKELALKKAVNGEGLILRVKNETEKEVNTKVKINGKEVSIICECELPERDSIPVSDNILSLPGGKLGTYRIRWD